MANDTHCSQLLAGLRCDTQSSVINIICQVTEDHLFQVHTQADQHIFYVSFQFVYRRLLVRMSPVVFNTVTTQPQSQAVIFTEFTQSLIFFLVFLIIIVTVTKLKEADISILTLHVVFYAFQSTEQQCLTHTVQVRTQRIHQHHTMISRIRSQLIIISRTSQ